jgi:RNA polymerase sigma-70 factor, ECF subfamily
VKRRSPGLKPDVLLDGLPDLGAGPEARYEAKETIALAFVAAVQHLPPRQRAVLVLRDVLGFRSAEVADMLDSSEASVNSALQRARATMDSRRPGPARTASAHRSPAPPANGTWPRVSRPRSPAMTSRASSRC